MNHGAAFVDGSRLRAESLAHHVEVCDELDSTNNRAGQLSRDSAVPTPALVVARHQTAGRGRGRNVWWADDGALTFSLLVQPASMGISTANWPQTSLAVAVAVCDALGREQGAGSREQEAKRRAESAAISPAPSPQSPAPSSQSPAPCSIRWPNDVMLGGRKVCGILVESSGGAAPAKDRLVIGVGVNVNNSWSTAPLKAGTSGTALCDVTGRQHNLEELLLDLLAALGDRLAQLAAHAAQLPQAWQRLDLLAGREVSVATDGRSTAGTCTGIAADGALVVDTAFGPRRLYSGVVAVIGGMA